MTREITMATVCTGIGAAELGFGFKPLWASEIEPFPCAVLRERFPDTPNLGDMTKLVADELERPDVICAGTPCQSFSVAGLRKGLGDARGQLAFRFVELIDGLRTERVVWENVPGVLSSWTDEAAFAPSEESSSILKADGLDPRDFEEVEQTNDFDQFTAALTECGYGLAWGILDAQYFGVARRRKRVFVVGSLRGWTDSAAILFDESCLSGNPAPSRETGTRVAAGLTRGADSGGKGGYAGRRREDDENLVVNALDARIGMGGPDDNAAQAGHLIASTGELSHCLNAGGIGRQDYETETLIVHALCAEGFDASEDGTGRGTPITPILESGKRCGHRNSGRDGLGIGEPGDPMFTLQAGAQHAIAFDTTQITSKGNYSNPKHGDPCHPLTAGAHAPAIAYRTSGNCGVMEQGEKTAALNCNTDPNQNIVRQSMRVRRLTPKEAERLQGFPDNFTAVDYRGKPAADGARYRAIGNAMCVNVMRWIGERIRMVDGIAGDAIALPLATGRGEM